MITQESINNYIVTEDAALAKAKLKGLFQKMVTPGGMIDQMAAMSQAENPGSAEYDQAWAADTKQKFQKVIDLL